MRHFSGIFSSVKHPPPRATLSLLLLLQTKHHGVANQGRCSRENVTLFSIQPFHTRHQYLSVSDRVWGDTRGESLLLLLCYCCDAARDKKKKLKKMQN